MKDSPEIIGRWSASSHAFRALNRWSWLTRPVAPKQVAALLATALALLIDIAAGLLRTHVLLAEARRARSVPLAVSRRPPVLVPPALPDSWGPQPDGLWIAAALGSSWATGRS